MKSLELKNAHGTFAVVDDEDYERVSQWQWLLRERKGLCYAIRYENQQCIFLHREIMRAGHGTNIDHRNGDGLNNTRLNLRFCTHTENLRNSTSRVGSSKFKGVHWDNTKRRWCAQITIGNNQKIRRYFQDDESAARVYDQLAIRFFGAFARLNFAAE